MGARVLISETWYYLMVNAHLETKIDKAIKRLITLKEYKRFYGKPDMPSLPAAAA
jgi:hypothetical protein